MGYFCKIYWQVLCFLGFKIMYNTSIRIDCIKLSGVFRRLFLGGLEKNQFQENLVTSLTLSFKIYLQLIQIKTFKNKDKNFKKLRLVFFSFI